MGVIDGLRFAIQRSRGSTGRCAHTEMIRDVEPSGDACEACLQLGDRWVHLRACVTCGLVGCCNSSKNRHAGRHSSSAGHPIARSIEPGEDWLWCFVDATTVEAPAG